MITNRPHPGLFIVLESAEEGAGKTTLLNMLPVALQNVDRDPVVVREPGTTAWAEQLRTTILDPDLPRDPRAELLALNSARADLVHTVIRPALADGKIVISSRYTMSTFAYQGGARGLPDAIIAQACAIATGGLTPDITLFLRLSPQEAERRRANDANRIQDAFEIEPIFEAARKRYANLAAKDPSVVYINADVTPDQVLDQCMQTLTPHLPSSSGYSST